LQNQIRSNYNEEDVEKLARKLAEVQVEVDKLKAENKMLHTNHREDMRNRDKEDMAFLCVVGSCVMLYACMSIMSAVYLNIL
jgi:phosphopantothenoylcysteine synthetase/decarboxylase